MTIYDIAKEAGVSGSTVSRVINGRPGISESTRRRVEEVLRKYDYSPDEAARGLVSRNSGMIGILVSDIRNLHYTEGAYIIEKKLLEAGFCSIIFNTGEEPGEKASYIKLLASRRVKGVVLIGSSFCTDEVSDAISVHLPDSPVVIANGRMDLPNAYSVVADEESGVRDCVRHLSSLGRSRIVYLDGRDTPSNAAKRRGYLIGMEEACLDPRIVPTDGSYGGGLEAMSAMLKSDRIDGVIGAVDLIAAGAERAISDHGLSIPSDISIIGIDNSPFAEICNPRLTSLDTRLFELSTSCADVLLSVLSGGSPERVASIPPALVVRET